MKNTNIERIKKELAKGFGMSATRNGNEYAHYSAGALDAGIATRAKKAAAWRLAVIELSKKGQVTEARIKAESLYIVRPNLQHRTYTIYFVNGKPALLKTNKEYKAVSGTIESILKHEGYKIS